MAALEDSSFGRLFGALFSPGKTFRSIAERPTWGVALVVLLLASGAVGFVAGQRTDYREMITRSLKDSGREVPAEKLDRQIEITQKVGPYLAAGSGVFVLLVLLLITLFYWIIFKLLGSDFTYLSGLSVTLHAAMPAVVSLLLSLPVILSHKTLGYEDVKAGTFLRSNLAFLAPPDAKAWVVALLASVDFFSLWSLVLTVIGYRALSRLSTQAVAITVVVVTLLFIAVRVGLATLR
ncbi:MAG TPA: YIP1 family protein [Thermoanaerobaculia bacterium]